jgi:hypothetical protein
MQKLDQEITLPRTIAQQRLDLRERARIDLPALGRAPRPAAARFGGFPLARLWNLHVHCNLRAECQSIEGTRHPVPAICHNRRNLSRSHHSPAHHAYYHMNVATPEKLERHMVRIEDLMRRV